MDKKKAKTDKKKAKVDKKKLKEENFIMEKFLLDEIKDPFQFVLWASQEIKNIQKKKRQEGSLDVPSVEEALRMVLEKKQEKGEK